MNFALSPAFIKPIQKMVYFAWLSEISKQLEMRNRPISQTEFF